MKENLKEKGVRIVAVVNPVSYNNNNNTTKTTATTTTTILYLHMI